MADNILNNVNSGLVPPPKFGYNPARSMEDISNYFNISRYPDFNNIPSGYFGHILMTRPSLNIPARKGTTDSDGSVARTNLTTMSTVGELCRYMLDDQLFNHIAQLSRFAGSPYLPITYNRAKTYNTLEYELNTVDSNSTFFGHTIKYGVRSEDHKKATTLSIDFRNDRFLSIYHLFNFWELYIKYISNTNFISPHPTDEMYATLDYYGAIYYFITKRDMSELVYWEKRMLFPIKISTTSLFDYTDGLIAPNDTISVDFQCTLAADPMDPEILQDINNLSFPRNPDKANQKSIYTQGAKPSREDYFNSANSLKYTKPFITSTKQSDGRIVSRLLWL